MRKLDGTEEPPAKCFIPKRQIHTWTGHNKGVSAIRWFPKSAHLLLSGAMDNKVRRYQQLVKNKQVTYRQMYLRLLCNKVPHF